MAQGNGHRTPITAEEYAVWEARMAANGAVPGGNVEPPSSTEQALAVAAASNPGELIPLYIRLDDPEFDFTRLGSTEGAAREAVIAERKRQVEEAQAPVVQRLTQLGAVIDLTFWAANTIVARVPAQFVATVATWGEVNVIQYDDPSIRIVSDSAGE